MATTITETIRLTTDVCATCGITFAVPDSWQQRRRDDGKTFYCPNGHSLHFGKNTLEKRLERAERERNAAQVGLGAARDQLDAERRSHAATKGQLTKTRKRVSAGVCPCCHRTFQNVARHMAGQHPEYGSDHG